MEKSHNQPLSQHMAGYHPTDVNVQHPTTKSRRVWIITACTLLAIFSTIYLHFFQPKHMPFTQIEDPQPDTMLLTWEIKGYILPSCPENDRVFRYIGTLPYGCKAVGVAKATRWNPNQTGMKACVYSDNACQHNARQLDPAGMCDLVGTTQSFRIVAQGVAC
ncbi:hypothetical protein TWF481_009175 [Arthrobotrys musiformis]|uniref:Uncharacterized protein n=1 Tax=Arthrobotrys musiformis TaxID=47236 RepID=A0AAV9W2V8_9PEZI